MDVIDFVADGQMPLVAGLPNGVARGAAKGMACAFGWRQVCLALAALLAVTACDSSGATVIGGPDGTKDEAGPLGQMELNLVGQGSQGTLFRLRDAVVTVQGPNSTLFFDSEDKPDSTSFSAVVPAGTYTSFLQEGWRLERIDSGKTVANAALISPNPDQFDVFAGGRTQVALRFRAGQDVVVTDPGLFEITVEVEEQSTPAGFCATDAECSAGQVCCLSGFLGSCRTLAAGESCPLPDLTVSGEVAEQSLLINEEFFPAESCAIEEGCVVEPGNRRLLRFSTMTPNVGDTDLVLGDPTGTPGFEFAPCHQHYHFNGYARYELLNSIGAVVAVGHKQAFCLLDSVSVGLPGTSPDPQFHCGFQGLTRGWADIYDAGLDCQWVDITDVPDGDYLLRITINPDHVIQERSYDNNTVEVPVVLGPPLPVEPLEPCAVPQLGLTRECGWEFASGQQNVACTPGTLLTLGCGCKDPTTCAGDPMLRVCDGAEACGLQSALAAVDDTCDLCPQLEFSCPPSGRYSLMSGSYGSDGPYSCDVK